MRYAIILLIITPFLLTVKGQEDVVLIPGGLANAGKLETIINSDTTDTGERVNPNRIYELEANTFHIQHAPIRVHNPDGTLTIRGAEGETKPVIVKQAINEVDVALNQIVGNLTLDNLQYQGMQPNGHINYRFFAMEGNDRRLIVEDCLFEHCFGMVFNLESCLKGLKIYMRNNYWRDFFNHKERWEHRIFTAKVPLDTLIFENNTVTGGGLTLLMQQSLTKYALINHNTFINNHNKSFTSVFWKELYFTNNLYVNGFMLGEEFRNIVTNPDSLLGGIVDLDTIRSSIRIQDEFVDDQGNLTEEVDSINDIIFYAADNIVTSSSELDFYYNGGYNDLFDAPVSYLAGPNEPVEVLNTPGMWHNRLTNKLIADNKNIVDENNHIYNISVADLGLGTYPLTQKAADVMVQWIRFMWGNRDALPPTRTEWLNSGYHFGDYDPNTIPGIETEDGSGISKISDLIEDFSYTYDIKSKSDGHSIGALHWTDEIDIYDPDASITAIKAAYKEATERTTSTAKVAFNPDILMQNYPNPFTEFTSIKYTVHEEGNIKISIYNTKGDLIEKLIDKYHVEGTYEVEWRIMHKNIPGGIYIYKLESDSNIAIRKMILM